MKQALSLLFLTIVHLTYSQYGPKSPAAGATDATVAGTAWTNPGNVLASDNTYATVAPFAGVTQLLRGTNFGFALLSTDVVAGIKLEIEKSHAPNPVTISGAWTVGATRPALAAGINRCLVVVIGVENSLQRDIATVSYGGRPMTLAAHTGIGTPFYAATDTWYMLESDLVLTSGTTISYTFGSGIADQDFEIVTSALFVNVDQASPLFNAQTAATTSTSTTFTMTPALSVDAGSLAIFSLFNGNPVSGTAGNCTSTSFNSGFTKVVDYLNYNAAWTSSGGTLAVATKSETATGTEAPLFTSTQTPNRRTINGVALRRARNFDNVVQLRKSTGWLGNNQAATTTDWPTADAYSTYGNATDLWGASWTYAEINNAGFGAGISASLKNNGALSVDHMRITVYTTSILPVELISFEAERLAPRQVKTEWLLGSEYDVDHYTVERSKDGFKFVTAGTITSEGATTSARKYDFTDAEADDQLSYYRLKITDTDGNVRYSDMVSVNGAAASESVLYPNPSSGFSNLELTGTTNEVIVTDLNGRVIEQFEGNALGDSSNLLINLEQAPEGTYLIIVRTPSGSEVKKLQKVSAVSH